MPRVSDMAMRHTPPQTQLFIILVALEVLLLCLRALYSCMAAEKVGALLRMVLIVIRVSGPHLACCPVGSS